MGLVVFVGRVVLVLVLVVLVLVVVLAESTSESFLLVKTAFLVVVWLVVRDAVFLSRLVWSAVMLVMVQPWWVASVMSHVAPAGIAMLGIRLPVPLVVVT